MEVHKLVGRRGLFRDGSEISLFTLLNSDRVIKRFAKCPSIAIGDSVPKTSSFASPTDTLRYSAEKFASRIRFSLKYSHIVYQKL